MSTFKFAPLYIAGGSGGSKKVGEIEEVRASFMSNGDQLISIDEVAESTGIVTTEGSFNTVLPYGQASVDMLDLMLKQTPVEIGFGPVNGKFYKAAGKINRAEVTSTARSGTTRGVFSFRGGTPKVV